MDIFSNTAKSHFQLS